MSENNPPTGSILHRWTIPSVGLLMIGLSLIFSRIGEPTVVEKIPDQSHSFAKETGEFRQIERHFQENDKSPVIQGIEKARIEGKVTSKQITIIKEKGSNADVILPEMARFLKSSGYSVLIDSAIVRRPKELLGLLFVPKNDGVAIYVGII